MPTLSQASEEAPQALWSTATLFSISTALEERKGLGERQHQPRRSTPTGLIGKSSVPRDYAVHDPVRAGLNELGDRGALLLRKAWLRSLGPAVQKAIGTMRVEPKHPVAQPLPSMPPIRAASVRFFLQDRSQRQEPGSGSPSWSLPPTAAARPPNNRPAGSPLMPCRESPRDKGISSTQSRNPPASHRPRPLVPRIRIGTSSTQPWAGVGA